VLPLGVPKLERGSRAVPKQTQGPRPGRSRPSHSSHGRRPARAPVHAVRRLRRRGRPDHLQRLQVAHAERRAPDAAPVESSRRARRQHHLRPRRGPLVAAVAAGPDTSRTVCAGRPACRGPRKGTGDARRAWRSSGPSSSGGLGAPNAPSSASGKLSPSQLSSFSSSVPSAPGALSAHAAGAGCTAGAGLHGARRAASVTAEPMCDAARAARGRVREGAAQSACPCGLQRQTSLARACTQQGASARKGAPPSADRRRMLRRSRRTLATRAPVHQADNSRQHTESRCASRRPCPAAHLPGLGTNSVTPSNAVRPRLLAARLPGRRRVRSQRRPLCKAELGRARRGPATRWGSPVRLPAIV